MSGGMRESPDAILARIRKQKAESFKRWKERHPDRYREAKLRTMRNICKILKVLTDTRIKVSKIEGIRIRNRYEMFKILIYYFYATRYNSDMARKKLEEMGFKLERSRSKSSI